jgi:hypothetical protein
MPIAPPTEDKRRALARVLLDAGLQLAGPLSALGPIWGFTHPTAFESAVREWQVNVTEAVNSHEDRIAQLEGLLNARLQIGTLALDLAFWLCSESQAGLERHVEWGRIVEAFPQIRRDDLEEAVAELEHHGFVESAGALGATIVFVTPQSKLFWAFDHAAMGYDTLADARAIAELWLEGEKFWVSADLEAHVTWDRRRLNPPLAFVMRFVGDGRISHELQPDYPTNSIFLIGEDRFRLRQFLRSTGGEKGA